MNFYNEHDPDAAAWLRQLIVESLIPPGVVDQRSITEIQPHELSAFTQCHFFAGIGGWSLALQLARWDSARPVWTGSCPCQPFSIIGKGAGKSDQRHLWPVFHSLIAQCRPEFVFGEQVADAIGKGWLDGVSADLEAQGYACGAAVLGAHSIGGPHLRRRLYWLAHRQCERLQGHPAYGHHRDQSGRQPTHPPRHAGQGGVPHDLQPAPSAWDAAIWHTCMDGKHRRIPPQPALFPMADGLPYKLARGRSLRVPLLKASGNAIVPALAAEFILSSLESLNSQSL